MKYNDVAFLVFLPEKTRRKNNSFDGNGNIGAQVISDVLERNDITVDYCSAATAHKYKIILVSLTSTYDCIAFYKAVVFRPEWQYGKRKFTVICGGFGMQNPTVNRKYIDCAVFGRGEDIIYPMVSAILGGANHYEHESVMNMPDIYPVKIRQADRLYDSKIFKEGFIGCGNKCKFCHYTWVRKRLAKADCGKNGKIGKTYVQGTLTKNNNPEILFRDIPKITKKYGRIRTAIDGFSENMRRVYGKKITDKEIIDNLEYLGEFDGTTVIIIYNIGNMPGESQDDRDRLYNVLTNVNPKNRVIAIIHTTPFRASLATPLQYAEVNLKPQMSDLRFKTIADKPNFLSKHSMSNESSFSQLQTTIVERATEETDMLFHTMCFSSKIKQSNSAKKIRLLNSNFDLSQYLRRYDPSEENHPGWFLKSYNSNQKLGEIFLKTEKNLKIF